MTRRFYLDTSIWRDYYENRNDKFRPLGEWALKFIQQCLENNYFILYSDFLIEELETAYQRPEISQIFEIATKILHKVTITPSQKKEAALLCKERKVSWGDALHAILARDNRATIISRDEHFLYLTDIAEVRKPEELI